ncbi:hypothetical protein GGI25_003517 [Coemansia spiralis]|uniref:Short/branched chain specific acyl-CoA dehydrogenase, mitochondrial n=2 Tax=Coemansia TaxID=4863 RepID=A0A9W8G6Z0_9FUNG|nr:acyl-CoA dehydrogenase/oxidase [Coemansia spiralis]KAJ1990406.1 hypothetical protein EDC05_004050 [Coemansia umbellata]KAJ2676482.1 hypothetical protein GGI25_003517 [Coemansia spiralis]
MFRSTISLTTRRQLAASIARHPTALPSVSLLTRSFSATRAFRDDTDDTVAKTSLHTLTEDEQMMREMVSRFAVDVVQPKVSEMDEAEKMDPAIIKGLFDNGLMGVETPAEFSGAEASFLSAILVIEELARIDPSISVLCDVHNTLVNTVFRHYASDHLKQKYLPLLATEKLGCFCLSEAGSGSDAFALQTRAELKGDHYVINGSKMWITNSGEADIFLVFATVDPSKGYKGITCFVVERDMGVTIAKKEKKLGIRASSTCQLSFDDMRVPVENVVGEVGKGYKIAIEILNEGRIGIAAQMLGLAQGAFDTAMPYMFQRKQFGSFIGDFQAMQHQYAQIAVEIEAARLLTYNAARLKEEGKPFIKEAAMAKLYASQVAERASSKAVEWMGGVGFTRDVPAEKFYRDCKIGAIYEGTSNIQLQTIAKLLAKDYRE